MKILKNTLTLFILLLLALSNTTVHSQSYRTGKGLVYAYAGATFANVNTSAYFETPFPQVNRTLDLESDLLFPSSSTLFYIKGIVGGRLQLVASYMSLHRSGNANLSKQFAIGDSIYEVGAKVSGYFNTDYLSGSLRVSLLRNPVATAGLSLGARYLKFETGINAQSNGYTFDRAENFNVPVILPGIHASVYPLSALLLRGSLEYFELSISGTKGKVVEANFSAEYFIFRYLGVGAGYMINNIEVTGLPENDVYLKDLHFDLGGFQVFGAFRF